MIYLQHVIIVKEYSNSSALVHCYDHTFQNTAYLDANVAYVSAFQMENMLTARRVSGEG